MNHQLIRKRVYSASHFNRTWMRFEEDGVTEAVLLNAIAYTQYQLVIIIEIP